MDKPATSLVGRETEIALLRSFVQRSALDGDALLLLGDAGVGKTELLHAGAEHAAALGVRVLRGAGAEFEVDVSFSALNQLLGPVLGRLGELSALHRDALSVALGLGEGTPPDRLVVSNAALELLRRIARDRPVLLVVDDVAWLDRSSAHVLGFLARRTVGDPVGFLGALRAGTGTFFERSGLAQYEVGPLDEHAADELLSTRFPGLARDVHDRLLNEAAGNPLALLELPAALSRSCGARSLPAVLPLGDRLHAVFAARVTQLPAKTRSLLLLAALDDSADLLVLRRATGDPEVRDLAPAERGRLVSVDPGSGRVLFRHPLTRSAVVELSTAEERRAAHRTLAGALVDEPERRTWHLAEATIEPNEQVAARLEVSARRMLARGDPVGAVRALTRAAGLSPDVAERGRRLTEAAFVGANMAGDFGNVARLVAEAREIDAGFAATPQAATTAAFLLLNGDGDIETAHRILVGAIDALGDELDAADEHLGAAIYLLLMISGFARREDLWKPCFAILERMRPETPEDLFLVSRTAADPVRLAIPALDRLDRAIARVGSDDEAWHLRRLAWAAVFVDRLSGLRTAMERLADVARESGALPLVIWMLNFLCKDYLVTGDWDELERISNEGLNICAAEGLGFYVPIFRYDRGMVAASRGQNEVAREHADEMIAWAAPRGSALLIDFAAHIRGLSALGRGDFEDAYHQLLTLGAPGEFRPYLHRPLWVCMDLVEAAVRTGRRAEATAHVTAMHELRIAQLSPRIALLVAGASGVAADDDADARAAFEQGLTIPNVERWPFDLARVRLLYGERLRRARRARDARAQLTAALSTFERLGAQPWATRAGAELRATGGPTGASRALASGTDPLTAQEQEIAALAAAGLTNKQIGERLYLSHRTVASHLYRIFPKLGITTRAALRDALPPALDDEPAALAS